MKNSFLNVTLKALLEKVLPKILADPGKKADLPTIAHKPGQEKISLY